MFNPLVLCFTNSIRRILPAHAKLALFNKWNPNYRWTCKKLSFCHKEDIISDTEHQHVATDLMWHPINPVPDQNASAISGE